MAVVRQQQRFFNKPIGVTRLNTGESELWQQVSQAADSFQNMAIDYQSTVGVQQVQEAAMGAPKSDIMSIDPYTKKPVALSAIEQYGTVKAKAYSDIINRRFLNSIGDEIETKGQEYALKYQNSTSFQKQMSKYVQDMSESADGMYSQAILETGTEYVAKATRTMKVAEHKASVAQAKQSAIITRVEALRHTQELAMSGASQDDIANALTIAEEAINNEYRITGKTGEYYKQLDRLDFSRASVGVTELVRSSVNFSNAEQIALASAIKNPLNLGLLTGPNLSLLKAKVQNIQESSNFRDLDKLAQQFKSVDEAADLVADAQEKAQVSDFQAGLPVKINNALATLANSSYDVANAIGLVDSIVDSAPDSERETARSDSLSLVSTALSNTLASSLGLSSEDDDQITLRAATGYLLNYGTGNAANNFLDNIKDQKLKEALTSVIEGLDYNEVQAVVKDIESGITDLVQIDSARQSQAEKVKNEQLAIDTNLFSQRYGALKGYLEAAEGDSVATEEAVRALYSFVTSEDGRVLATSDQTIFATSKYASALPKAKKLELTKSRAISLNNLFEATASAIATDDGDGNLAELTQELSSHLNVEEASGLHSVSTIDSWGKRLLSLEEDARQKNEVYLFASSSLSLVEMLQDSSKRARDGNADPEFLAAGIDAASRMQRAFPIQYSSRKMADDQAAFTRNHANALATRLMTMISNGTNGAGLSPTALSQAIAQGRGDRVDDAIIGSLGKRIAEEIKVISKTPNFDSRLNTIIGELEGQNKDLWAVTVENATEDAAIYAAENQQGTEDQNQIYADKFVNQGEPAPNYFDPATWGTDGNPTDFARRFQTAAGLNILHDSFVNLVNNVARGGISGDDADTFFGIIGALSNASVFSERIDILNESDQISEKAKVRLSEALRLFDSETYATPAAALAVVISRENEFGSTISNEANKILDKKPSDWVRETFPDANLSARKMLLFAVNEAIYAGANSEAEIEESVSGYIDRNFNQDDKVLGAGVDGMVDKGRSVFLTISGIDRMNSDIIEKIGASFSPEEKVKYSKFSLFSSAFDKDSNLDTSLSAYSVTTGSGQIDLDWKLKPVPNSLGAYSLGFMSESGIFIQRTVKETINGEEYDVPMIFDVSDYKSKSSVSNLLNLYEARYKQRLNNDSGGRLFVGTMIQSTVPFVFSAVEDWKKKGMPKETFDAREALLFVRSPEILKEDPAQVRRFFELVDDGYIDEEHIAIFQNSIDGLESLSRPPSLTREDSLTEGDPTLDPEAKVSNYKTVIRGFKLNMRNYTHAEWKSMGRDERVDRGLPFKLPLPSTDELFLTRKYFATTPESSNWQKNFHKVLNLKDAMSLYTKAEWDELDRGERLARGLPTIGAELFAAGGASKFKKAK